MIGFRFFLEDFWVCRGAPRARRGSFRNGWRGRKPWALCSVFADSKISGLAFPKLTYCVKAPGGNAAVAR